MLEARGRRTEPFPDNLMYLSAPSLWVKCRKALQTKLPWAFYVGPNAAAIHNVPLGVPVAKTGVIFYNAKRATQEISISDSFLL
jgi:hypothetical protein